MKNVERLRNESCKYDEKYRLFARISNITNRYLSIPKFKICIFARFLCSSWL
jgi:hypothetical protein